MELLIVLVIETLKEVIKHIVKELWTLVKKRIKKATFTHTPKQRRKGGKTK